MLENLQNKSVSFIFRHNNDLDIIEANAAIALETFMDNPDIDVLIVPAGGGGLISGIAFFQNKFLKILRLLVFNLKTHLQCTNQLKGVK